MGEQIKKIVDSSKNILIKGLNWVGNKTWEGITYVWENKEELRAKAEDSHYEKMEEFQKKEDRIEKLINNQSQEQKNADMNNILKKHRNNETLSMEEMMYFKKVKDQVKK